jgi:glycerophosphoryl diester phosphodiesterase
MYQIVITLILLVSTWITALQNPIIPFKYLPRPFIIAHRGSRYLTPESTLIGFETAVALGAHVIEFDIRATIDNVLVVYHDDKVYRTTDGIGFVRTKTLEQIKKLDAAYKYTPYHSSSAEVQKN